ncbi:SHOCT domain-containing protein [Ligilactobacillus equi]|uniref:SHOCT domain-containing protein n=1 Tax=Ligilactobacillus equi DPC 6820 TaxID=1392007 RepID=V7HW25_9LACO|nr:SHOCT domain-containing protein [Ligilactobacillus equi]ETA73470.1 hypothetical protein LEQ_1842c [Ligilactobacillus equi DPC 6820]
MSNVTVEDIKAKKKALGYSEDISRIAYVEASTKMNELVLGAYGALFKGLHILSFEDNGILFMGINALNNWNESDFFLPASEIQSISFRKKYIFGLRLFFNAHELVITKKGETSSARYICYTTMLGKSFLSDSIPNIEKTILSYPKLAEVQTNQNSGSFESNLDKLSKLKKLLDSDAITQEEFDEKKKELLKNI